MNGQILLVDDDVHGRTLLLAALRRRGLRAQAVSSAEAAALLNRRSIEVLVVCRPDPGLFATCRAARARDPRLAVVVVAEAPAIELVDEALAAGAIDLVSGANPEAVALACERAVEQQELQTRLDAARGLAAVALPSHTIPGASEPITRVNQIIEQAAASRATVLVAGESGTGKELVARALHELRDPAAPFVAVNCAALPAALLESELFGHAAGAFTEARRARSGLFVEAGVGTLFLDEIGEMPLELQVKVLRALQEHTVRPVGSDTDVAFRARVIVASHRDLAAEVKAGRFRNDLYYRVDVLRIDLPPLRERPGDVFLLALRFLARAAARLGKPVVGITLDAARVLAAHDWPGNVRELENCIERAVALARHTELTVDDLPVHLLHRAEREDTGELLSLEQLQRQHIEAALQACVGNKSLTARVLGLERRGLYRRLHQFGLIGASSPSDGDPLA